MACQRDRKGAFRDRTKLRHRTDVKRLETWATRKGVRATVEAFNRRVADRYVHDTIVLLITDDVYMAGPMRACCGRVWSP